MLKRADILDAALSVGFNLCGIARYRVLSERVEKYTQWLDRGFDSSLHYMRRGVEKRFDPKFLLPDAASVIVCAVSYKNEVSGGYDAGCDVPRIASYACTTDYHVTVKTMLRDMAGRLGLDDRGVAWRCFTDSAPILEKAWAVEAGLGWIGRNSLLVTPRYGSFVVLGEIVVSCAADVYDTPYSGCGCGDCRRCVDSCPTGAITEERMLDTGRCISRLTVEKGCEAVACDLHGWIFGCDECQNACPYNMRAAAHTCRGFDTVFDPRVMSDGAWASMSEQEFGAVAGSTPLSRAGYLRVKGLCAARNNMTDKIPG